MTEQTLFRSIVARSWKLVFERKSLWILGLLAAGVGGMGVVEFIFSFVKNISAAATTGEGVTLAGTSIGAMYAWLMPPYNNVVLPVMGVLFLLVTVILFLVTIISYGALIRGTVEKKSQPLHMLWHHGVTHMWSMAGLVILRRVVNAILLAGTVYLTIFISQVGGLFANGLHVVLWILSALILAMVSFMAIYGSVAMSLEGFTLKESLVRAWHTFRRHPMVSIEMAFLVFLVELGGLMLVGGIFVIIAIPVYLAWVVSVLSVVGAIFKYALVLALIILFVVGMLAAAWYMVFQTSVWSSLYLRTREGVVSSRLLHFFGMRK